MLWLQLHSALAVLASDAVASRSYPPIPHTIHYDYPDIPWPLPSQLHHDGVGVAVISPRVALECGTAADGCDPEACAMPGTIIGRAFDRARGRLSPKAAAPAKPGEVVLGLLIVCVHMPTVRTTFLLPQLPTSCSNPDDAISHSSAHPYHACPNPR